MYLCINQLTVVSYISAKDKISGRIQNTFSYNEDVQERPKIELNYKNKKITNYLSYEYQHQNSHSNDESLSQTSLTDKVFNQGTQSLFKEKYNNHTLLFSPKFEINKKSYIDAQYQLMKSDISHEEEGEQFSFYSPKQQYITKTPFTRNDKGKSMTHSLMLRYYHAFSDLKNLTINAGYYNSNTDKDNSRIEQNEQDETITDYTQNTKNNNYSANVEFNTRLFKKLQFNTGLDYSFIRANYQTDYNREVQGGKSQSSLEKRHIGSGYMNFNQNIKKFFYSVGLRGEYSYSNQEQERGQFNLMPVIGLNYRINKNISTNFYYRYFINRPTLYDLRNDVYYISQYMYGTGNPDLKNTSIHSFRWTLSLPKNISFTINYSLNKNPKINVYLPYDKDSEILLQKPVNLNRSSILGVSGSLWEFIGKYLIMLNLNYDQQFIPHNDLSGEIKNSPHFRITWQNEYTVYKGVTLYTTARYEPNYKTYPNRTTASYGIDAGSRIRIKNFNIMVEGYNLLYKHPRISTNYGNVFYDSFSHASQRMLKISISYRFNKLIEPKANKILDNIREIGG